MMRRSRRLHIATRDAAPGARARYTRLHWGLQPDEILSVEVPRVVGTLVELGVLTAVAYVTSKGTPEQVEFTHRFRTPYPLLCVDEDKQLWIIGGGYDVNVRGIVG